MNNIDIPFCAQAGLLVDEHTQAGCCCHREREEVYERGKAGSTLHVFADEWSNYSVVRAT
jgi:hypothetical protein